MKKLTMSKKKWKLVIIFAALAVLIFAACYTVFIAPLLEKEEWIYKETSVERGTLTVGVTESGTLEFGISSLLYQLDLNVESAESDDEKEEDDEEEVVYKYLEIEEIYAVMGQRITQGEALIKFSDESVKGVRKLLENALIDAKADYLEAEEEYNLSMLEAKTTYDSQILTQSYAEDNYNTTKASLELEITTLTKELADCEAKVEELQENVTDAQESYNEALTAYNEAVTYYNNAEVNGGYQFMYAQTEYINAQTRYQNAKSALSQAIKSQEENVEKISSLQKELEQIEQKRSIELLEAEAAYKEAEVTGQNAEITYKAQVESFEADLREALAAREEIEEKLAAFEAYVGEDGILYAEGSGIVTQLNYEAGDSLMQAGTLLSYAQAEDMTITVDVTQEDIVDLSVGDAVEIVFTAYEDVVYPGSILSIDTTATSLNSNTVSYNVVLGVGGETEKLYGGMVADVTFVTEQKENVLYVSKKAIVSQSGKTYVYCDNALGGKELVEVETGLSNGSYIEILSGLDEGDVVYITSRVSSESEVTDSGAAGTQGAESTGGNSAMGDFTLPDGMELPEGFDPSSMGEMPGFGGEGGSMPDFGGGSGGMQMPGGMGGDGAGGRGGNSPGGRGGRN